MYGHQWRTWDAAQLGFVDQIAEVLENMHYDPNSRRHIVSAWNADRVNVMALPPCHTIVSVPYTGRRTKLSTVSTQC